MIIHEERIITTAYCEDRVLLTVDWLPNIAVQKSIRKHVLHEVITDSFLGLFPTTVECKYLGCHSYKQHNWFEVKIKDFIKHSSKDTSFKTLRLFIDED